MDTMGRQMDSKATVHAHKEESGIFSSNRYPSMGSTRCKRGKAGRYGCKNIDVVGSLAHDKMGSKTRAGNDIWGKLLPPYKHENSKLTVHVGEKIKAGLLKTGVNLLWLDRQTAPPSSS